MTIPIAPTPILTGKDADKFITMVNEDLKIPAYPIPTPKLERALEYIRQYADRSSIIS